MLPPVHLGWSSVRSIFSATFTDTFLASKFATVNAVEHELKWKLDEILKAADGRKIRRVTFLVDWVDEP